MAEWWSYLLAALALYVAWQLGRKKASAWLVGMGMQLAWIAYAVSTRQYGFIASSLTFLALNWHNYLKWRREEVKAREV